MAAVNKLLLRRWWSRTWIRQEVILAKDTILLCGPRQVESKAIHRFVMAWIDIKSAPHLSDIDKSSFKHQMIMLKDLGAAVSRLKALSVFWHSGMTFIKSLRLSELLWYFENQAVTLPQDKVYGLLGLV